MLENRINRRAILHGAITLAGTLAAVQFSSPKKAQAQSTPSNQRKGILLAVDLQNGFLTTPECKAVVPKVVERASQFHQVWATRFLTGIRTSHVN
ncbi:MAG: hypothetical protein N4J56_006663 [Chroococcidiopsis sp. SAG 2025]|uniref:hypothetical protein n=1 Tax=Chroococcidiopsis sp. SAG 2025 TaxID=171389 RepID=UPI002936ECF9|nr:hypothetical protein [Chroococcidiopsis sp. SAG 2025]MDV2996958.1 hypothetical protein [Chroococcidiopsis sp. SAG 2025]